MSAGDWLKSSWRQLTWRRVCCRDSQGEADMETKLIENWKALLLSAKIKRLDVAGDLTPVDINGFPKKHVRLNWPPCICLYAPSSKRARTHCRMRQTGHPRQAPSLRRKRVRLVTIQFLAALHRSFSLMEALANKLNNRCFLPQKFPFVQMPSALLWSCCFFAKPLQLRQTDSASDWVGSLNLWL